jgi:hypothetical protein
MTYSPIVQDRSSLRSAIVKVGTPDSVAVNGKFMLSGTAPSYFSIVSGRLRLQQGRSYYLEASPLVQNASRNGAVVFQWYDSTNSVALGSTAEINLATSFAAVARVGRRAACALVTSSDVGTGIDVELRIMSLSGSGWNMTITTGGISTFDYVGYPSARILELS